VLEHVGQPLLDDAEGGQVHASRNRGPGSFDSHVDAQSGVPHLLYEFVEPVQPGLRAKFQARIGTSHDA
jgi:hypothetical protein